MDYPSALAWLYGRQSLGIKLGLDKVQSLLHRLDNPQQQFPVIHIAGTNGKGSVARYLHSMLQAAGYRVGITTSPHLHAFTERIAIDEPIRQDAVCAYIAELQPHCDALDAQGESPTFFELVCAMAWLHFARNKVDIAVVETGLGGRLDATNVFDPLVTIITNIGMDHEAFLGPDLASITFEKAGIMKPGVPLVTGVTGAPLQAITTNSHALKVPMSVLGRDYISRYEKGAMRLLAPQGEGLYEVPCAMQCNNAALAVAAIDALATQGWNLSAAAVAQGMRQTQHPGRMEQIGERPVFLLDCAHNVDGAHALRRHLAELDWGGFDLIVGFSRDKKWQEMLDQWVPLARHVHAVPLPNARSVDPQDIANYCTGFGIPCTTYSQASDALGHVRHQVVVAGSMFLVGHLRATLLGIPEDPHGIQ